MSITMQCPTCAAKISAPDKAAGKRVKCPSCADPLLIPSASDASSEWVDTLAGLDDVTGSSKDSSPRDHSEPPDMLKGNNKGTRLGDEPPKHMGAAVTWAEAYAHALVQPEDPSRRGTAPLPKSKYSVPNTLAGCLRALAAIFFFASLFGALAGLVTAGSISGFSGPAAVAVVIGWTVSLLVTAVTLGAFAEIISLLTDVAATLRRILDRLPNGSRGDSAQ